MELNSSLEEEITSSPQEEIEILQEEIGIVQEEIGTQLEPGGRNHLGPGKKSLRTQEEIT